MQLSIINKSKAKSYIRALPSYDFESSLDLVLTLFLIHPSDDRLIEMHIYELLSDTGLKSLDNLGIEELAELIHYLSTYRHRYPTLTIDEDKEKLSYLLMAAIKREDVILIIDDDEVMNLSKKVRLTEDSTICFFKRGKLDSIDFKTL